MTEVCLKERNLGVISQTPLPMTEKRRNNKGEAVIIQVGNDTTYNDVVRKLKENLTGSEEGREIKSVRRFAKGM